MVAAVCRSPRIRILTNRIVVAVSGDDERGVTSVTLRGTRSEREEIFEAAGVLACLGAIPNGELLNGQVKMDEGGYIRVGLHGGATGTSVEGVFAAGEVADPIYKQAITAAAMGCQAALDAERWLVTAVTH
jgi:thioredoxin reductase (NADPH)